MILTESRELTLEELDGVVGGMGLWYAHKLIRATVLWK